MPVWITVVLLLGLGSVAGILIRRNRVRAGLDPAALGERAVPDARTETLHPFLKLLLVCSGANVKVLAQVRCRGDRARYAGIGGAILLTALLAWISGGYALYTVFSDPLSAVVFGFVWALVIFNLDRLIVGTIRPEADLKARLLAAVPRLLLAVGVSIVISKPIELRIFREEIRTELQSENQKQQDDVRTSADERYPLLAQLRAEKERIESAQAARLSSIEKQSQLLEEEIRVGHKNGPGFGPEAKLIQAEKNALVAHDAELRLIEEPRLKEVQKALDEIEARVAHEVGAKAQQQETSWTLMTQIRTLEHVIAKEDGSRAVDAALVLLFILIECAPVLTKLMFPKGPYELVVHLLESRVRAQVDMRHQILETKRESVARALREAAADGKIPGRVLEWLLRLIDSDMAAVRTPAPAAQPQAPSPHTNGAAPHPGNGTGATNGAAPGFNRTHAPAGGQNGHGAAGAAGTSRPGLGAHPISMTLYRILKANEGGWGRARAASPPDQGSTKRRKVMSKVLSALFLAAATMAAVSVAGTACAGEPSAADVRASRAATTQLLGLVHELDQGHDPRRLFVMTHYLISSRLTDLIAVGEFDRPDLVARMNREFVSRLPGITNDIPRHWAGALEACGPGASESECAEAMARAHIQGDLSSVMNKLPCIPQADWDRIYERAIMPALSDAIQYVGERDGRGSPLYREFMVRGSQAWTRWERDAARLQADCR